MKIIAGKFRGASLKAPKGLHTRPTPSRLREAVFNIIQHKIEGCAFLDLFAGSGLTGFEAISRGAGSVTFVDNNFQSIQCIKSNAEKLGVIGDAHIIRGDVITFLERISKMKRRFDLIYADPPYDTSVEYQGKKQLLSLLVLLMVDKYDLLIDGGTLFIEERRALDLHDCALKTLAFYRIKTCGTATLHEFHKKP